MAGPINWFSQIASITKFGLLSIPQRRGAVAATVIGIAGVVAVLVGVLSMAAGFRQAMTVSGSPDGADRPAQRRRQRNGQRPGPRRDAHHCRCAGRGAHGTRPARVRGIVRHHQPSQTLDRHWTRMCRCAAWNTPRLQVRDNLKIVQGRMFEWGKNEVIVGARRGPGIRRAGRRLEHQSGPLRMAGRRHFFRRRRRGGIGNLDRTRTCCRQPTTAATRSSPFMSN